MLVEPALHRLFIPASSASNSGESKAYDHLSNKEQAASWLASDLARMRVVHGERLVGEALRMAAATTDRKIPSRLPMEGAPVGR
jgi:hypothetical protein